MLASLPYVSYLRVYEPLSSAAQTNPDTTVAPIDRKKLQSLEQRAALAALAPTPQRTPDLTRGPDLSRGDVSRPHTERGPGRLVYALDYADRHLVCPISLRLRCWQAMTRFSDGADLPGTDLLVPKEVLASAEAEYARWRAANPGADAGIRTATWGVPLVWFLAVDQDERQETIDGEGRLTEVRFLTPMVEARRRVGRAHAVMRTAFDDGPLVEATTEFGSWLENFHPHSVVEIDYAGLLRLPARLFDHDTSASDVAAAVRAVADSDPDAASTAYQRVVKRWRAVQAYDRSS